MSDINCPYCNAELEICHDDGFGYEEGVQHQDHCHHCDKYFIFTTSISFYYESYKADCLNDEKHEWKPTTTILREYSRMACQTCGEERKPTETEMEEIIKN